MCLFLSWFRRHVCRPIMLHLVFFYSLLCFCSFLFFPFFSLYFTTLWYYSLCSYWLRLCSSCTESQTAACVCLCLYVLRHLGERSTTIITVATANNMCNLHLLVNVIARRVWVFYSVRFPFLSFFTAPNSLAASIGDPSTLISALRSKGTNKYNRINLKVLPFNWLMRFSRSSCAHSRLIKVNVLSGGYERFYCSRIIYLSSIRKWKHFTDFVVWLFFLHCYDFITITRILHSSGE